MGSISNTHGFTLIELIIAVSIVGILSAISISGYLEYIGRSQISAAFYEIRPAKAEIDVLLIDGISDDITGQSESILKNVGIMQHNYCSEIYVDITASSRAAKILCTIKGNAKINGKIIQLSRAASSDSAHSGEWTCSTNLNESIRPKACTETYTP